MVEVKKKIKCGFAVRKTYDGQKDFDVDYIDVEVKKVIKKVGDGEEDYILEDKIVETRRPIKETIEADADNAGLEAYLKPYVLAGEPIPGVKVDKETIVDTTIMPEDLAGALAVGDKAVEAFNKLPKALVGDCKDYQEFLTNLTKEKFEAYINSLIPKVPEEKKEEVK